MKTKDETATAPASTPDPSSDRELTEKELEIAAGGTAIPFPRTPIPEDDSVVLNSPTATFLQTNV